MADEKEYIPLIQLLIRNILRKFYEPHHCVIMDILLEHMILKESEICAHMKMLSREFNKLIIKLREDKLIRQESKIETGVDGRQLLIQCYFIDYRQVKDIIKYKIYKMSNIITKRENKDINEVNVSYKCTDCESKYSILEAQAFLKNYQFICPDCSKPLVENKDENSFELHSLMMKDLQKIIEMLKKADTYDIPTMDYFQVMEMKKRRENLNKKEEIKPVDTVKLNEEQLNGFNEFNVEENTITFEKKEDTVEVEKEEDLKKKNVEKYFVKVNGVEKEFSLITDEDQDKMSEKEYEEYFEIYEKVNEGG